MEVTHPPDQGKSSTDIATRTEATTEEPCRIFMLTCAVNTNSALALKKIGAEEICYPGLCELAGLWSRLNVLARAVILAAARALAA